MRSSEKLFQDNINVINTTKRYIDWDGKFYVLFNYNKKKKNLSINSMYTVDPQKT